MTWDITCYIACYMICVWWHMPHDVQTLRRILWAFSIFHPDFSIFHAFSIFHPDFFRASFVPVTWSSLDSYHTDTAARLVACWTVAKVTGSSLVSGKVCDRTLAAHADIAGYTGLMTVDSEWWWTWRAWHAPGPLAVIMHGHVYIML